MNPKRCNPISICLHVHCIYNKMYAHVQCPVAAFKTREFWRKLKVMLNSCRGVITVVSRWQNTTLYLELFTSSHWELCIFMASLWMPKLICSGQVVQQSRCTSRNSQTIPILCCKGTWMLFRSWNHLITVIMTWCEVEHTHTKQQKKGKKIQEIMNIFYEHFLHWNFTSMRLQWVSQQMIMVQIVYGSSNKHLNII